MTGFLGKKCGCNWKLTAFGDHKSFPERQKQLLRMTVYNLPFILNYWQQKQPHLEYVTCTKYKKVQKSLKRDKVASLLKQDTTEFKSEATLEHLTILSNLVELQCQVCHLEIYRIKMAATDLNDRFQWSPFPPCQSQFHPNFNVELNILSDSAELHFKALC